MKSKPKLTDADKPKPAKGGRAIRAQRRKAYYGAQPQRTIANKKRTLGRHIARHPMADDAQVLWVSRYGKSPFPEPCTRALRRIKRQARAARRAAP